MRLSSFRIYGCFGFDDSREVDLDPAGGITYLLGRNSSGKTSFLQALLHLESGMKPKDYKNFENFSPPQAPPKLVAQFTCDIMLDPDLVSQQLNRFLVSKSLPEAVLAESSPVQALYSEVRKQYGELFEVFRRIGRVRVEKSPGGGYGFSAGPQDAAAASRRLAAISGHIQRAFPQNKFKVGQQERSVELYAAWIENFVFLQFPRIYMFDQSYALNEDLPDRLTLGDVDSSESGLQDLFISLLGREDLVRFLGANDPDVRDGLLAAFKERAAALTDRINRGPSELRPEGLLRLILHENNGLQVTVQTDEKKSFYRHLSDNTKILLAYHLHTASWEGGNDVALFDEPNTGFHPTAQEFLQDFFDGLSRYGTQVVISTHSEHLLDLTRIGGVRLMGTGAENKPIVKSHPFQPSRGKSDLMGLQPLFDAIGLRYGSSLRLTNEVVLLEGVTDLLYLRGFGELFKVEQPLRLAPMRGDNRILNVLPFFIGQGVGVKALLDEGGVRAKLQEHYAMGDEYILEVAVPAEFRDRFRGAGIEDLFSKADFAALLRRCGVETDASFEKRPNSRWIKNRAYKRMVAQSFLEERLFREVEWEEATLQGFERAVAFCASGPWFRL